MMKWTRKSGVRKHDGSPFEFGGPYIFFQKLFFGCSETHEKLRNLCDS